MVQVPKEYHFKIVFPTSNPSEERYKRKLVRFVDAIFPRKGNNPGRSPLAYDNHHVVNERGQTTVLVSLKLHSTVIPPDPASEADLASAFKCASKKFCKQIFHPNSRPYINTLTTRSILGLSPVANRGVFNNYWNRAALCECLRNIDLLDCIDEEYRKNNSYLPEWARIVIFAVAAGINSTIDMIYDAVQKGVDATLAAAAHVRDPKLVAKAQDILKTMMQARESVDEEIDLSVFHEDFIKCIRDVVNAIKLAVDTHASSSDQTGKHPDEILWTALYQTTEVAAAVATANDKTFKAFIKHQEAEATLTVASAAAAVGGIYAGVGLVTTQTMAPLATWGLSGVAGIFTTGSLPVVTSTALAVTSWPVLLTAAAIAGGLKYGAGWHGEKRDALHKKVDVYQTFVQAWKVVHDTQLLLTWINCTDRLRPVFMDSTSQKRWAQFIKRVKKASGRKISAVDFKPAAVKSYLDDQREMLEQWLEERTAREDESGNVTEDE
ncbi:hypothetical protein BDD12DRAFT_291432 [Trichophaea hybrida]|nr:hypothetical protein BDD12DRAFT_291432 [Trichophaea hybrida]